MQNQSDYGYETGGIEARTIDLCVSRARTCSREFLRTNDPRFIEWRDIWMDEARSLTL